MSSMKERRAEVQRKHPKLVKFLSMCLMVGAVVLTVKHCSSPDKEVQTYPWTKAETACWNYVRSATGAGLMEVKAGSNKDWGKDGYAVNIHVEKEHADLSVMCYAKADGTVIKVGTPKVVIN